MLTTAFTSIRSAALAIVILMMASLSAQAQDLMFGPRLGFGFNTDLQAKDLVIRNGDDLDAFSLSLQSSTPEVQMGFFGRVGLGPIFLQPEVLLATSSVDYTLEDLLNGESREVSERTYQLSLPIMAGVKLGPVRAQAGPVYRVHLGGFSDLADIEGMNRRFEQSTLGLQAGLGFDLGRKVALDFRYEADLTRSRDEVSFLGNTHDVSSQGGLLVTSLGISF